ncbi:MAG: TRAP transporter large permease subunit, partial [Sphaerochaetaceae bacterium]|nr:TRAP transporter large permease subunit [Sphaerochaetaceae bacterium]
LYEGSKQAIPIAVACAGAGIIVGVIGVTGLGTKIASGLFNLANGNMLLGLLFTMIAAIILGAGMPVTAVYIILAATLVQPLAAMGVQPIAAHMFIFIFSAMAGLTPPVAITSYTAAGIANADPNKVAIQAFLYGLPGFIIPFMFVISPSLLMQGNAMTVITSVVSALIGVLCLVATIEGYFIVKWPIYLRPLFAAAALLMMWPGGWTDLIGLVIIVVAVLIRWLARAKQPVSV